MRHKNFRPTQQFKYLKHSSLELHLHKSYLLSLIILQSQDCPVTLSPVLHWIFQPVHNGLGVGENLARFSNITKAPFVKHPTKRPIV